MSTELLAAARQGWSRAFTHRAEPVEVWGKFSLAKPLVIVRQFPVSVQCDPARVDGLRIAHVSDMHFRRWNRVVQAAQDALLSIDYDLIAVTGDFGTLHRSWEKSTAIARRFFEPLAKRTTILGALGNHDVPDLASAPDLPITFLLNESKVCHVGGVDVRIVGLDQSIPESEDLALAFDYGADDLPTVLLAHYPSTAYRLDRHRVDLQLSGHTHGGQIRLPGLGCIWPNDAIPRDKARGLHVIGDTQAHVSAGIGVSPPIFCRYNCPAEITVLSLTGVAADPPRKTSVSTKKTKESVISI